MFGVSWLGSLRDHISWQTEIKDFVRDISIVLVDWHTYLKKQLKSSTARVSVPYCYGISPDLNNFGKWHGILIAKLM